MPSTCVFEFDRPDPVYYAGETINGRILLTTTKDKNVRDVVIRFEGTAKVHWEESRTRSRKGKSHHYTEHFRATTNYVQSKTSVFSEGILPPGTHTYTFLIPLPEGCPTSCVEKFGKIFYEISLKLDRPLRFDNVFTRPITVIHQSNLNLYPNLLVPIQNEDIKYFCCWPCSSGPVTSILTLPFGGYAAGQKIKYKLEINNESSKYDLDAIEIKFKQHYKFISQTPSRKTRHSSNTLANAEQSTRVLRLSKRIIDGELLIPPVPPSSEDNDDGIITVSYQIKMLISAYGCHGDSEIEIPIQIGTIPLVQSAIDPSHAIGMIQPMPAAPATSDTIGAHIENPPSYDIYKPPSFEEATSIGGQFIDTDVEEHNRTDGFIPKYPMYTSFAVPPTAPTQALDSMESVDTPLLQSANNSTQGPPYPVDGITMPMPPTTRIDGYGWKK